LHKEILNKEQLKLLPLVNDFKKTFYLVGGTAIALQIGHRRSIDFDLFKKGPLNHKAILDKISVYKLKPIITRRVSDQMNITLNGVKFTFFEYPFEVKKELMFDKIISMPPLLDLAAMKAYALGRRSKWKDYVDLYYSLSKFHTVILISLRASEIFVDFFSEKQFRAHLSFFEDVDYSEKIEFIGKGVSDRKVKNTLTEMSISLG
jgi:hypothetical protein